MVIHRKTGEHNDLLGSLLPSCRMAGWHFDKRVPKNRTTPNVHPKSLRSLGVKSLRQKLAH
jgi:hypothetical protein